MKKKMMTFISVFVLALSLTCMNVSAAVSKNPLSNWSAKDVKSVVSAETAKGCDYYTPKYSKNFKMTATSSNKKVATVKVYNFKDGKKYSKGFEVIQKGYGTTTIKVKVVKDGKTYTKSCKYTFYKYKNPFTTFKINGKGYKATLDKKHNFALKKDRLKGKVTYKLKSGYKIQEIVAYSYAPSFKAKNIKSGSTLPKNTDSLLVTVKNKKTGANTDIWIYLK